MYSINEVLRNYGKSTKEKMVYPSEWQVKLRLVAAAATVMMMGEKPAEILTDVGKAAADVYGMTQDMIEPIKIKLPKYKEVLTEINEDLGSKIDGLNTEIADLSTELINISEKGVGDPKLTEKE